MDCLQASAAIILATSILGTGLSYFHPINNMSQTHKAKAPSKLHSMFSLGLKLTQTYGVPITLGSLTVTTCIANVAWAVKTLSKVNFKNFNKVLDTALLYGILGFGVWTGNWLRSRVEWSVQRRIREAAEQDKERHHEKEILLQEHKMEIEIMKQEHEIEAANIKSEREFEMEKLKSKHEFELRKDEAAHKFELEKMKLSKSENNETCEGGDWLADLTSDEHNWHEFTPEDGQAMWTGNWEETGLQSIG